MKINLLLLNHLPIFEQLQLEEALLRTNDENWCLVNHGSTPAIVLGVSAKPLTVINANVYQSNPVPLIRRFSGGGTVYIDPNTLFVTFIFQQTSFPDKALQWSKDFYSPIFSPLPFQLKENDYTLGEKKFGGNAQYFRKDRFLHHTSFLFDYDEANMGYLLYPPKTPKYREGRSHSDFLTKLSQHYDAKTVVVEKIQKELSNRYELKLVTHEAASAHLEKSHRKTTSFVELI